MSLSLLIEIILLLIALGGIFSYHARATYQGIGSIVAAIAVLLLFLLAIKVIHL